MLLREFTVDDHTISLTQDHAVYVTQVLDNRGEKVFFHEYNDYEKIKSGFDEIVQIVEKGNIDDGKISIQEILAILKKSTV